MSGAELHMTTTPEVTLQPHQQRVVHEAEDLQGRATRLLAFIGSSTFDDLLRNQPDEAEDLRLQHQQMGALQATLRRRIERFHKGKPVMSTQEKLQAHAAGATEVDGVIYEVPAQRTHQQIADDLASLGARYVAKLRENTKAEDAERNELRRQCGEVGHVFANSAYTGMYGGGRTCAICGEHEQLQAEAARPA